VFAHYYIDKFGYGNPDVMVVSPDVGSVARARAFAMKLGVNMAIVDKRREVANKSEVMNIIGDVTGKTVILLDDMVDTAGSLCGAANALVERGGAKEVYACASHGVLSGPALERIEASAIKELRLCDTIPYPADKPKLDKIQYESVASLFAEAIKRVYEEVSISSLFD
jgi:ribose-phosphate pyrophosphokinase